MEYLTENDYEIAEQNGIPRENAKYRFYTRGWSKERAVTQPVRKQKDLWNKYKNISVVTRTGFYDRVKKGMPPEKAATTPPMPRRHSSPKISKEQVEIAKQNGISYNTLAQRVYVHKWPVEEAMTTPVHTKYKRKERRKHG